VLKQVLPLVDGEQPVRVLRDEAHRVGLRRRADDLIVQGDCAPARLGHDLMQQRRLADLARSLDHDDARVLEGLQHPRLRESLELLDHAIQHRRAVADSPHSARRFSIIIPPIF